MATGRVKTARTVKALRRQIEALRDGGKTVALVPTMGALHDGHLKLVALARRKADRVVVSIFVNPKQFAPHEDFGRYPRDEKGDIAKLAGAGTDLVWLPEPSEMYSGSFATRIVPEGAALGLETEFRPHFFGGVATVVAKLLNQVAPDVAIFGEKDYQQLAVVRQMVRDLDLPVAIVGAPTTRDPDGLALSSRNAYLSAAERAIAPALHATIVAAGAKAAAGQSIAQASADAVMALLQAGFTKVDYVEIRDADTLAPFANGGRGTGPRKGRVLAAAWLGRTRLIDNVGFAPIRRR